MTNESNIPEGAEEILRIAANILNIHPDPILEDISGITELSYKELIKIVQEYSRAKEAEIAKLKEENDLQRKVFNEQIHKLLSEAGVRKKELAAQKQLSDKLAGALEESIKYKFLNEESVFAHNRRDVLKEWKEGKD